MRTCAELARANFDFGVARPNDWPHPEWQITFLFYATLHALHVAAWGGKPPEKLSHNDRDNEVSKRYPAALDAYIALHRMSNDARYRPRLHPMEADLDNARELARVCFKAFGVAH